MARLLILGENFPGCDLRYKGTYRAHPSYRDDLPESDDANQLFFWFVREAGEVGVVHCVQKACELVRAYERLDPPQTFDVIEVVRRTESPEIGKKYMGIDLSCCFNYSLLSWGLHFSQDIADRLRDSGACMRILPLLRLIEYCFVPRLNLNGLFDDWADAQLCLECMMSVQSTCPNLWESSELEFECVALWKVCADQGAVSTLKEHPSSKA
ncbi:MAG: hypothetical protein GXP27_21460 [Planctomycetes bacterium]|nr:hypothetical protein [Planctomycetota bacterium]